MGGLNNRRRDVLATMAIDQPPLPRRLVQGIGEVAASSVPASTESIHLSTRTAQVAAPRMSSHV